MRNFFLENNVRGADRRFIRIIKYDAETGLGIIRCGHNSVNQFLYSIREGRGLPIDLKIKTLGTSGSIKALKRKFLSKEFK
jgi:RNase P/RNase MRP subunit POP5